MKKIKTLFSLILILIFNFIFISCEDSSIDEMDANLNNNIPLITTEESNDLEFLIEEEKLARDVYLYAFNKYNFQIFKNIASSEQQHMNSVLKLMNKYNISNPSSKNEGEFSNEILQALYFSLTKKCDTSLVSALEVGNIIEDMDIFDISENEKRTEKLDILKVYSSLKCGSRNHLRNFHTQLVSNDGSYFPDYISENTFNSIINSDNERCGNN